MAYLHQLGKGIPDIFVGFRGENYLFEIKDGSKPPSKRTLTPDEEKWHAEWNGKVVVVNNIEEVIDALGIRP